MSPASRVIDVRDAVGLVRDGATVVIGGSGAGHALTQRFIDELAAVYQAESRPRDLTTVRVVGIGDFADRGFSQLGLPGLMRRTIGSNIGNEPRLGALVEANQIESYSFPQGVLSQLMREIAAGRPGLVTAVGLGTYVDPRQTGGKQNACTTEDLVEVVTLRGQEWLFFHAFPIDVAVIRGTTADEDGNLTMEGEAVQGEMLAMAMAARNSGGIVIAQVRQLATRGSLPMRDVKVPVVLKAGYGFTAGWAGQHTGSIYGMFMGVPGLKVAVPATAADAKGLMTTAIRDDNPVAFFHHYLLTLEHGDVPDGEYAVPFGEAAVLREGGDVTIVAVGWMVGKALAAAEQLASEGVSAEVIDPRTLAPLDTATILGSVEKTGRLVVVDQSTRHGSAAAVIAAEVASDGFASLKGPVGLVTALDATIPYSQPMEDYLLPDEAKIVGAVQQVLGSEAVTA